MSSKRKKWLSGIGAIVLIGGGLANYGTGILSTVAQAAPPNLLTVILDKLDRILTAIGGITEGNHTLRWDTNHPSASRFTTGFPGAVLDKNTGLVWELSPDVVTGPWVSATFYCATKNVGGTVGWRLPSVIELKSVQDPSLPAPFVPASIFTGIQSSDYWSASTLADTPTQAWDVHFGDGNVSAVDKITGSNFVWCVRGAMNADQY